MNSLAAKPRVLLFDVYKTLLRVTPRPDAGDFFQTVWQTHFNALPPYSWKEFEGRVAAVIAGMHARDRARGVPFPEIQWPQVLEQVVPGFVGIGAARREALAGELAGCSRCLGPMPGADSVLRAAADSRLACGIVSNAQAYTLAELEDALGPHGFGLDFFDPALVFWSFRHGFSKPDPHVFQILAARIDAGAIPRAGVLMVGDRQDNDIIPARSVGFSTWHVTTPEDLAELARTINQP